MKKIKIIVSIIVFVLLINSEIVDAFYKNDNGVEMNKEEYEFLTNFYCDEYPKYISLSEYESLLNNDIFNSKINYGKRLYEINLYNNSITSNKRNLKITSACNSNTCLIGIVSAWNSIPTVKSYDVIGARLDGVSLISDPITYLLTPSGKIQCFEQKKFKSGFGFSIKIPNEVSALIITQSFYVSKGGKIFGSYQHATKNVTLNDSKNYKIDKSGYGKVFKFSNNIANVYDKTPGVEIAV